MELKINFKNYVLCIQIGYGTKWFSSIYWMTICREFYDDPNSRFRLTYASFIKGFFKKKVE